MDKVLFESKKLDWGTPQKLFDFLNEIFQFDLDVCADHDNAKCYTFISEEMNSLSTDWIEDDTDKCWMNPPYGRGISPWIEKAYNETRKNGTVVCLVPSRTDTQWFQYMWNADALIFLEGRLKFEGAESSAPFPSVIGVFGWRLNKSDVEKLEEIGKVIFP